MTNRHTIQLIYEVRRAASATSCTFFAVIIARGRKKHRRGASETLGSGRQLSLKIKIMTKTMMPLRLFSQFIHFFFIFHQNLVLHSRL